MPRDHARIKTRRRRDDDFRQLTAAAQHIYDTVLTDPDLSYAGVLTYLPGRIAEAARDLTEKKVDLAVRELERGRYVVVDRKTHEILIRSYARHDGVLERANMGKALGRALERIVSAKVRDAVRHELARLHDEAPTLAGWHGLGELYPDELTLLTEMGSTRPLKLAGAGA